VAEAVEVVGAVGSGLRWRRRSEKSLEDMLDIEWRGGVFVLAVVGWGGAGGGGCLRRWAVAGMSAL
jgi:hypothetical protein